MTDAAFENIYFGFVDLGITQDHSLAARMIIRLGAVEVPHLVRDNVILSSCLYHLATAAHWFRTGYATTYAFIADEYSEPVIELVRSGESTVISASDEWGQPYDGWAARSVATEDFFRAWAQFEGAIKSAVATQFPECLPHVQRMLRPYP